MTMDGLHFFILEDEPIIAFGLEDLLLEEGAKVSLATALDEAAEVIESASFDFAILDVNVRGEKSYGIARTLLDRDVPIMFATGYGDSAHSEGFENVPTVTKPYSMHQIKDAMKRLSGV